MQSRAWRVGLVSAGVLFILAGLVWFFTRQGREISDQWGSIFSVFLGVIQVFVGLVGRTPTPAARVDLGRCAWGVHRGRLPVVAAASEVTLGVKEPIDAAAHGMTEYIPRDGDARLIDLLAEGGVVLLHGPAGAGKSRSAAQTIRVLRAGDSLLMPHDGKALRILADSGFRFRQMVIWLDDLERYLGADGLDGGLLEHICGPGSDVSIVATIRDEVLSALDAAALSPRGADDGPALVRPEVQLVRQIPARRRISVGARLSPAEYAAAYRVADPRIGLAAAATVGFGEYLIAGPAMMRHWTQGEGPAFVLGAALISAAVDCRRAGYEHPIPSHALQGLSPNYLPPAWRDRADLPSADQALEWACRRVLGASSCLIPHHDTTYKANDYLLDRTVAGVGPLADVQIASAVWPAVLALADAGEAFTIGHAAVDSGVMESAFAAFKRVAQLGNPLAMFNLGLLRQQRGDPGDLVEAERWYRRAADLGQPDAMNNLAALLHRRGDLVEAERWYRQAADLSIPRAMNNLAVLLKDRGEPGDLVEAERWYLRAAGLGDPAAIYALGVLRQQRGELGDLVEAERLYRQAAGLGYPGAINNMGGLLHRRGDLVEAERWFRRAAELGYPEAMNNLGVLLQGRSGSGDLVEAERWFGRAADLGQTEAMYSLAVLLHRRGDLVEAERWFRQAADLGYPEAMNNLAVLLKDRSGSGDLVEAEQWYRRAADLGIPAAMYGLGLLFAERGDLVEAEQWYRRAADLGTPVAMYNLGGLLYRRGDLVEAEQWYRQAADLDDPRAAHNLGVLLAQHGELEEAEQWLRQAAGHGTPETEFNLAVLLHRRGDQVEAERRYRRAADLGHPGAMYYLGVLFAERGDLAEAEQWYRQAANLGHSGASQSLGPSDNDREK